MLPKPPEDFDPRDKAEDLLNKYLTGGKYDAANLPKRLKRADADEILKLKFSAKEVKPTVLMRATQVMAFYDLRERAADLRRLLDRAEKEPFEFLRSLLVVEIFGDFGDAKMQQEADAYYKGLCGNPMLAKNWTQAIDTFVHLSPAADPKWISDPLSKRMKELEPEIGKSNDAAVEFYQLKDYQADRLATVLKAKKQREAIAANKDDHRRRQDLGQYYLQLERFAYVDMVHWAVLQLQRDCDLNSPDALAAEFSTGFDMIKSQVAKRKNLTDGEKADVKIFVTRCARAVDFYNGRLTPPQTEYFAAQEHSEQPDVLYWDPFDSKTQRKSRSD